MKTVVVLDSSEDCRSIYASVLQHVGLHVVSDSCGRVGLKIIRDVRPALVVASIHLKNLDGISLLRDLKKDEEISGIPVILLSTSLDSRQAELARQLGCLEYVMKPCPPRDLLQIALRSLEGLDLSLRL